MSCTVDDCEDGDHRSVDNELEWLDRNGAHCKGDSGGPALDNFGRVIGIVSRSRSLGEEICTSNHTYTSVYDWAEWIQYHTRAVSAEEGVESAPWTMGYSTLPEYNFPVGETCEVVAIVSLGFVMKASASEVAAMKGHVLRASNAKVIRCAKYVFPKRRGAKKAASKIIRLRMPEAAHRRMVHLWRC